MLFVLELGGGLMEVNHWRRSAGEKSRVWTSASLVLDAHSEAWTLRGSAGEFGCGGGWRA